MNVSAETDLGTEISQPLNKKDDLEEKKGVSKLVPNSIEVDKVKNGEDQVGGSKEDPGVETGMDKSNSSGQSGLKEDGNVQKGESGLRKELKGKERGDEKVKLGDGAESNELSKEVGNEGDGVSSNLVRNEGSRVEECDKSIMCTDEKKELVACLRVPGNGMY